MNRVVEKWNRTAARQAGARRLPPAPDALAFDDEMFSFVGTQERKAEMAKTSVTMIRSAIVDLVMYGPVEKVEVLFRTLHAAVKRIGKPVVGRVFRRPPAGKGGWPNLHDVIRWLDSLDASEEKAEDVAFLFKLYNTAKARVRPAVLEEVEKGDDPHALA